MTDAPLLVDTHALLALLDEGAPSHRAARTAFAARVEAAAAEGRVEVLAVPSVVMMELRRGLIAQEAVRRLAELERFVRTYAWIESVDDEVAYEAATLWADTGRGADARSELDRLVAAIAIVGGFDLVSASPRPPRVDGLRVWRWEDLCR